MCAKFEKKNLLLQINEKVVRGRGAAKKLAVAATGAVGSDISMEAIIMEEDEVNFYLYLLKFSQLVSTIKYSVHVQGF